MHTSDLLSNLANIERLLKSEKQLSVNWCKAEINWLGEEIQLSASVKCSKTEYADSFSAECKTDDELLQSIDNLWSWANSFPNFQKRALYSAIRRLRGAAEIMDVASAYDEAHREAWDQLSRLIRAEADEMALRGLPSPDKSSLSEQINSRTVFSKDGTRICWPTIIQYKGSDGQLYAYPDQAPDPFYELHYVPALVDQLREQGLLYSTAHTGRKGTIYDSIGGA